MQDYSKVKGVCDFCGVSQDCIRFTSDQLCYVDVCGEDMARALEELTGWSMLNMYRTMRVQSDLKIQNPKGVQEIPLPRRKRR